MSLSTELNLAGILSNPQHDAAAQPPIGQVLVDGHRARVPRPAPLPRHQAANLTLQIFLTEQASGHLGYSDVEADRHGEADLLTFVFDQLGHAVASIVEPIASAWPELSWRLSDGSFAGLVPSPAGSAGGAPRYLPAAPIEPAGRPTLHAASEPFWSVSLASSLSGAPARPLLTLVRLLVPVQP